MLGVMAETGTSLLALVGYAVGTGLATLVGFGVEYDAVQSLTAGNTVLAVWFAYIGAISLFVGLYLLGYQTLLPRLSGRGDPDAA